MENGKHGRRGSTEIRLEGGEDAASIPARPALAWSWGQPHGPKSKLEPGWKPSTNHQFIALDVCWSGAPAARHVVSAENESKHGGKGQEAEKQACSVLS